MNKTSLIFLILVSFVGLTLRLYRLEKLPEILNRDEAALAYNAYLLGETGRDEWEVSWPLTLQSFGDYKLPGYSVALIPLFSIFGMHDWVVRLPSALASTALIPLLYFLSIRLGTRKQWALIAAAVVAITPIFFFYGRVAFESILALALFLGAVNLFLARDDHVYRMMVKDLVGLGLFGIAIFTYNTPLLLLPFILPMIIWSRGWKLPKTWLLPVIGLCLIGWIGSRQLINLSAQKSSITIFKDETIWQQSVEYRQQFSDLAQVTVGNKYAFYSQLISRRFVDSFSPLFLVSGKGGHPWHSLPATGHIGLVMYVLFLLGVAIHFVRTVSLAAKRQWSDLIGPLNGLYLLVISLAPAAITVDAPHATRSLLFFMMIAYFAVISLEFVRDNFLSKINGLRPLRSLIFMGLFTVLILQFAQYLGQYFTEYPAQQEMFKPGFGQVLQRVDKTYPNQPIAVVDPEGFQYILLAWYLRMPAEDFFSSVVRQLPDKIGFRYGEKVGRYHFIADVRDRSNQEKIVLKWNDSMWEVIEY